MTAFVGEKGKKRDGADNVFRKERLVTCQTRRAVIIDTTVLSCCSG